jgi:L-threonylcarbamoyladenylate synthase
VSTIDEVVKAIRSAEPVILPTDTVYGLCSSPFTFDAAVKLYMAKRREAGQPIAFVAGSVDTLLECLPELRAGRAGTVARALLPGPLTLVVPNPARRFEWLTGKRQDTIGVRVPALSGVALAVLEKVAAVAATSANFPGEPDPRRLEDVDPELRWACAAELDGGELPGVPSTVLDLTGAEPQVLREGAMPAVDALALAAAA